MIVVYDTSPICYLLLIGRIELLQILYGAIIIPQTVADELSASESPLAVKSWIAQPPNWLQIQAVEVLEAIDIASVTVGLFGIDRGN